MLYQKPPKYIADLVDYSPKPEISVSPDNKWALLQFAHELPSIVDLAQPSIGIAGVRINPRTNGPCQYIYYRLEIKSIHNGEIIQLNGIQSDAKISRVSWSPDSSHIAFAVTKYDAIEGGIELWISEVSTGLSKRITQLHLNAFFQDAYEWFSDSRSILALTVPLDRGAVPSISRVASGPIIQESEGIVAPAYTFQDLIKNGDDEHAFEYYATSQLVRIHVNGEHKLVGPKSIIYLALSSPDGKYIMRKTRHMPYSYQFPVDNFPARVDVIDVDGNLIKEIASMPLVEGLPIDLDAVISGPRHHDWRADAKATLFWVEAVEGNGLGSCPAIKDILFEQAAPFIDAPRTIAELPLRFSGVWWGSNTPALIYGIRWADRKGMIWLLDSVENSLKLLYDLQLEDGYNDPGVPCLQKNEFGRQTLLTDEANAKIYWLGYGASAEGERPFVDELILSTNQRVRWWRSESPYYENPIAIIDVNKRIILTCRESQDENPNYYLREINNEIISALTTYPMLDSALGKLKGNMLKYKRADGVNLSATLYLPVNFTVGQSLLPLLIEAYPMDYKSRESASQVHGSPHRFASLPIASPAYWVAQGYAVLESPSIPIIGEGEQHPNDTYIEQLIAGAEAAIDAVAKLGIADRSRVAVMGHSYGAFMVANLLAHSSLFRVGIARSGAYNRTLTPFGFQGEKRSYWEAKSSYDKMSPFNYADKIKTPLLLLHGELDNNPGTFLLQSERFFNALKGHGAIVRYVVLPYESHGYVARESILHMLWETSNWLTKHLA